MKIGILGAGPAGLYFALLMKKHHPAHEICVVEQNPAGATYGWGVVFSERALSYLQASDAESYTDIARHMQTWDDQVIMHKGQAVSIDGYGFSSIARIDLLRILQEHCRRYGVALQFERRLADTAAFADCDLIVGADGVNSVVRQQYEPHFQPSIEVLSNKYIWYGTSQIFDALSLIFRSNRDGVFVAHTYRYSEAMSTFIVECDVATWEAAGFAAMSDSESRAYCAEVFRDDLDGHPLFSNKSTWLNFKVVRNRHWSYKNVVLIGDALRTVHFSIGSGTRMALEDAIALYRACTAHKDVATALHVFEESRRPGVEEFLTLAARSSAWYERFRDKMHLDPLPFAYDYMTRSGRVDDERLRARAPKFMAAYDAYQASRSGVQTKVGE
jgi:anthraniloyl-CoA monooxygenase